MEKNFVKLQRSEEELQEIARIEAENKAMLEYILNGKTKRQAEASGRFSQHLIDSAYATVRPWELPGRPMCFMNGMAPGTPTLTEKQKKIIELTKKCMTQKEIAREMKCSQSTVAFTLRKARQIQAAANRVLAEAQQTDYQTRIHLFLHGMDLWDAVKGVCLNDPGFVKDIEDALDVQSSEVVSTHLSYSPQQLDKLVMDIVLATNGRCVIIADSFAANFPTPDTHVVYFLRDCIHTKDISRIKKEIGWDVPINCTILYLDDWIRYLQVPLSENDAITVDRFNFWRGFYEGDEEERVAAIIARSEEKEKRQAQEAAAE